MTTSTTTPYRGVWALRRLIGDTFQVEHYIRDACEVYSEDGHHRTHGTDMPGSDFHIIVPGGKVTIPAGCPRPMPNGVIPIKRRAALAWISWSRVERRAEARWYRSFLGEDYPL